eukprot:TRINITY_DN33853_c0_g1_i1.p1 TRINITY_DN33853_c0_g1~~TRINITY_DN33853_c0_g1_i1.p1  ORF type:complete len:391 (+),score=59.77 TRINITY_DN33853_c0_g1_i1:95-1267(+)
MASGSGENAGAGGEDGRAERAQEAPQAEPLASPREGGRERSDSGPFNIIEDVPGDDATSPDIRSAAVGEGGAAASRGGGGVEDDVDFVQLQALLAGLARHAVPSKPALGTHAVMLVSCGGPRPTPSCDLEIDERSCSVRVKAALQLCCNDYPGFADVLGRLEVVYSCIDFTMLADHFEKRLFTVVRGTDRKVNPLTFPRDMGSNVSILLGMGPKRSQETIEHYSQVRRTFPKYQSYGSGHSLGGAIIIELAQCVDGEADLRLCRVDVFNTAASPFARSHLQTHGTELHVHRVVGDWASWGLLAAPPPGLRTYPQKPAVKDSHALTHFLPQPREAAEAATAEPPAVRKSGGFAGLWDWMLKNGMGGCVGSRKRRTVEGGAFLQPRPETLTS